MQNSPEQGQFMQVLSRIVGARKVIEFGTFTGYSTLCIARSLPEDGQIITCDISDEWTKIGIQYWEDAGMLDRIDLRVKPALETISEIIDDDQRDTFDFAFIDADKENYLEYYEGCLKLLRSGCVVCVDNTLWGEP